MKRDSMKHNHIYSELEEDAVHGKKYILFEHQWLEPGLGLKINIMYTKIKRKIVMIILLAMLVGSLRNHQKKFLRIFMFMIIKFIPMNYLKGVYKELRI